MNKFSKLYNKIFDYSLIKTTPIKFDNLINFSKNSSNTNIIKLSTHHLYKEMPIRFSHRIKDLNILPFGLNHNHNVSIIRDWYLTSLEELTEISEPKTMSEIIIFKNKIENIYHRHSPTLLTLTKGLFELKESGYINQDDDQKIQIFLDNFHTSRTEIRILIEYYLSLFNEDSNLNTKYFGIINFNINLNDIFEKIIFNINSICDRANYDIDLKNIVKINGNANLPGIPNYLYYILFEIVKNSTQAIILNNNINKQILIDIIDINDYIYIKITDNGIGIQEENLNKIWLYSYSSNPIEPKKIIEQNDFSTDSPLSGFGYGLPISKIYLNFFSSLIQIDSIYTKGTNVFILLKKYKY
jgi:pyruvate dehydrogenase kinase 2/3/4